MSYIIHFTTAATNKQGCTSTLDIGHRPKDFAKNVCLIFQWKGQMSHYFLVSAVIVWVFFCVRVTLGHYIAGSVTGWSPTVQVYI